MIAEEKFPDARRQSLADWRPSPGHGSRHGDLSGGEYGAWLPNHTRRQFHTMDRSDSGTRSHPRVARKNGVRSRFPKAASKNSLSDPPCLRPFIIQGSDGSGWQFDLTTLLDDFQITKGHEADGYRVGARLRGAGASPSLSSAWPHNGGATILTKASPGPSYSIKVKAIRAISTHAKDSCHAK